MLKYKFIEIATLFIVQSGYFLENKINDFLSMNYLQRLYPSTFKVVKNVGMILDLQQILLAPMNSQSKDVIKLFVNIDDKSKKITGSNRNILKTLRKMHSFKKEENIQELIRAKKSYDEPFNPFITHIQTDEIEAALIYDKGADSSTDWTSEEMELLQLIIQIVKADLLFESGNSIGDEVNKIAKLKQVSYQILELQYCLPLAKSLQMLQKTKQRLKSLKFFEGLDEFNEIEAYLSRSLKMLNAAKKAVDGIQANFWSQNAGPKKTVVEKIDIKVFLSTLIDEHNGAEAEVYYGHINPLLPSEKQEIYIRTVILKKFLNAVIDNAVKFSREDKAEIYVTTELDDLDLIITVRDMGIGIPEEEVQYIGDPFFKASNNETKKGLGVELSIIKRMIVDYGGSLKFESVENVYTEVVCNLPYLEYGLPDND